MKPILSNEERKQVKIITQIAKGNPFGDGEQELLRQLLGTSFESMNVHLYHSEDIDWADPNKQRMLEMAGLLMLRMHERLNNQVEFSDVDKLLYIDLVYTNLYFQFRTRFNETIDQSKNKDLCSIKINYYQEFTERARELFTPLISGHTNFEPVERIFAGLFQIRRAYRSIADYIIGRSPAIKNLRRQIWESIFSHNFDRYRQSLFQYMHLIACMITGPTGSGKELVARAIGSSRFISFNSKSLQFVCDPKASFYPINLSAMPVTLIESELFGHKRGAFTGATEDRAGWLEICPEDGTVFLDEIGEIDPEIQVKLLRVLQTREFNRIGEEKVREFKGKLIAATNRNMCDEIREGNFRQDLYYRICSDQIATPGLAEQIQSSSDALKDLIDFISNRILIEGDVEEFSNFAQQYIQENIPTDYSWPGNVRELEQCLHNLLIRGSYQPIDIQKKDQVDLLKESFQKKRSLQEVTEMYCTYVYNQTENYQETARLLNVDHRTVKKYIKE